MPPSYLSRLRKAESALREAERILANILNSLPDATFSIDDSGRVTAWNQAIEKMTGVKAQDMLGKDNYECSLAFYGERRPMLIHLALKLDQGPEEEQSGFKRHGDTISGEAFAPALKDASVCLWGTATALRDSGGAIIGAIESIRDITDHKTIEKNLRKNEERLRQTLESINDGIWDLQASSGQALFSPSLYTMLGYDPYEFPQTYRSWRNLIHPDDLETAERIIFNQTENDHNRFKTEMRLRTKSDGWRWVLARGRIVERDAEKRPTRLVGAYTDITERKLAENLYRTLAEKTMAGVYLIQDRKFKFLNNNAVTYLGYSPEELLGMHPLSVIHPEDRELVKKNAYEMLHGLRTDPYEYRILTRQGQTRWLMETVTSILYREKPAILGNTMNVTEKKRMEAELVFLSLTDHLTGLYNRRGFIPLAEQQLKAASRVKRRALLSFIDVDDLKWINDALGHEEGDNILMETAAVLKQTFRESDIIARIGGDEFVVLAIDVGEMAFAAFSKRLQQCIDERNAETNRRYQLAMSLGAAVYDPDAPVSLDELISLADASMYAQKKARSKGR